MLSTVKTFAHAVTALCITALAVLPGLAATGCAASSEDDAVDGDGVSATSDALAVTRIGTFPNGEGSGIIASKRFAGIVWAHRDGGASTPTSPRAALYAYKIQNGKLVEISAGKQFKIFPIPNASNQQWEDIGIDDEGNLWIGQIGSCKGCDHYLLKVREPDPYKDTQAQIVAKYPYRYPGSFLNSESLLMFENTPYLIAKTDASQVYRMTTFRTTDGNPNVLELIGQLPSGGGANLSGVDVSRDKKRMVVGAHKRIWVYETPNPSLTGVAFIKDMISRKPKWRMDTATTNVEGIGFVGGGYDVNLLEEAKGIYWAPRTQYETQPF